MRPAPRYLTRFYLMVSIGGAAGGLFVGLIAPRIFHIFLELPIALLACGALAALLTWRTRALGRGAGRALLRGAGGRARADRVVAWHVYEYVAYINTNAILMTRNFYGTLRVKEYDRGDDGNPPARWCTA